MDLSATHHAEPAQRSADVRALRLVHAFHRLQPHEPPSEHVCRDGHVEVGRGAASTARRLAVRDALMSSVHFAVSRERAGWALVDLASKNGTHVDGVRITHQVLREGDVVEAGASYFVVGFAAAFGSDLEVERPIQERLGELIARALAGRGHTFSRDAARALFAYRWPFEDDELAFAVEHAIAASGPDAQIHEAHLPEEIQRFVEEASSSASSRFRRLVTEHEGNVTSLSRVLGTTPSQVRRLARRHACPVGGR